GGVKQSGGFSLLFPEAALSPNESGEPAIVPGKPQQSEMIRRITHHDPDKRMPLDGDPLSDQEIKLLTKWIIQGAKWEDHWAYIKPSSIKPPPPSSSWGNNGIDRFVLDKIYSYDLQPSPEADKPNLLRRM